MTQIRLSWRDPNEQRNEEYTGGLPVTIGRAPHNTILLGSKRVSREHAALEPGPDGEVLLIDRNSSNGTLVNNVRMHGETSRLEDGDRFGIDPFVFTLRILPAAKETRPSGVLNGQATIQVSYPPPLHMLSDMELLMLEDFAEQVAFEAGDFLFHEGDEPDGFYIIDSGRVRIERAHSGLQERVLAYIGADRLIGELSMLDRGLRSAHAIAETSTTTRRFSLKALDALTESQPAIAVRLLTALGSGVAQKLRAANEGSATGDNDPAVGELLAQAAAAQAAFADWDEDRVNALLADVARMGQGEAADLARAAVRETGMGYAEDRARLIEIAMEDIRTRLIAATGRGLTATSGRVVEFAGPVGIVVALLPPTSPVASLLYTVAATLKSRSALIAVPTHHAERVINRVGELLMGVLFEHGAPEALVQWPAQPARSTTSALIAHRQTALVLAGGAADLVRSAHSAGRPTLGACPANTPVLVCRDADPAQVAEAVVSSKAFDHGLIPGAEHNLVVVEALAERFKEALLDAGAAILDTGETHALHTTAIDRQTGGLIAQMVGRDAEVIADAARVVRNDPIRVLVVPVEAVDPENPLCRGKLAPIVSLFTVPDEKAGIALCRDLLAIEGAGHTAIIHANNGAWVEQFAHAIPAARILVNVPGAPGILGEATALPPALLPGCAQVSAAEGVFEGCLCHTKRLAYPRG